MYMLKIARRGLIGDFLTMFKIQTQTVILLCEQVFTIFLCIGEYVSIEIISFKITRCKLDWSYLLLLIAIAAQIF